ncbi:hypothetical protein PoB_002301000 [Plakobranchus ocellatus]|uniref:Uncharacterized protein n=1 Tax=Plakobranchus ocellatus TaxID=259542 RepID=A0AAV3ZPJ3_9GAST|nr:hypothetical protein PoB_002301000 [Plakobranchus ocellatus]
MQKDTFKVNIAEDSRVRHIDAVPTLRQRKEPPLSGVERKGTWCRLHLGSHPGSCLRGDLRCGSGGFRRCLRNSLCWLHWSLCRNNMSLVAMNRIVL